MWDWHQKVYQGKIGDARKNGSVVLYGYDHAEVSRYNFVNAWPSKVTMSALKAGSNEVLMEEVTIVCEELERVK
jgi:phage tail-like protein